MIRSFDAPESSLPSRTSATKHFYRPCQRGVEILVGNQKRYLATRWGAPPPRLCCANRGKRWGIRRRRKTVSESEARTPRPESARYLLEATCLLFASALPRALLPQAASMHRPSRLVLCAVAMIAVTAATSCTNTHSDWRTASREPVGLAPDPAELKEAVVQVYGARASGSRASSAYTPGSRSSRPKRKSGRSTKWWDGGCDGRKAPSSSTAGHRTHAGSARCRSSMRIDADRGSTS